MTPGHGSQRIRGDISPENPAWRKPPPRVTMKEVTDVWLSAARRVLDDVHILLLAAVDLPGGLCPDGHLPQPRHWRLGQGRLDRPGDLPAADRRPGVRDRAQRPLLRRARCVSGRYASPGPAPRFRRLLRPRAALRPARPRRDQRRGVRAGKGEDPAVKAAAALLSVPAPGRPVRCPDPRR